MDYIYDIDEIIATPPYRLGTNTARMQCHTFMVPACPARLRMIVNDRLNAALGFVRGQHPDDDPPFGTVLKKTSTKRAGETMRVRYLVPLWVNRVSLSFYRYFYAGPLCNRVPQDQGWMQYTEVVIRFIVQREIEGIPDIQEGLSFPITIYIDDAAWLKAMTDPQAVPIILGREAFGLPKAPGAIHYCTNDMKAPGYLHLKVWDNPAQAQQVALADAIVCDDGNGEPAPSYCGVPDLPDTPVSFDHSSRFGELESILFPRSDRPVIDPRSLQGPPAQFRELLGTEDLEAAKVLPIPDSPDLLLYPDLLELFKLVALKQFPDPSTPMPPATEECPDEEAPPPRIDACYQGFVESAVEAPENGFSGGSLDYGGGRTVQFRPDLHRLKLKEWLGLPSDNIAVPASGIFWVLGSFLYGRPSRTVVLERPGP